MEQELKPLKANKKYKVDPNYPLWHGMIECPECKSHYYFRIFLARVDDEFTLRALCRGQKMFIDEKSSDEEAYRSCEYQFVIHVKDKKLMWVKKQDRLGLLRNTPVIRR